VRALAEIDTRRILGALSAVRNVLTNLSYQRVETPSKLRLRVNGPVVVFRARL
jgi:hypothetical protein